MLLAYPGCVYTTSRTVSLTKILELDIHIKRIAQSARLMMGDKAHVFPKLVEPVELQDRFVMALRSAVSSFRSGHSENVKICDLKLVLLADWMDTGKQGDFFLVCHASPLLKPPPGPIVVEVRGRPRHHALVKASSWIQEAKKEHDLKLPSSNEMLLSSPGGELVEGHSSNLFAVMDGVVWTAGEGVIKGTLQKIVLEICEDEGIPVKLAPPKIADLPNFEAVLISSTSRLVMQVNKIILPKPGLPIALDDPVYVYGQSEMAKKIISLVSKRIESHSVEIIERCY